MEKINKPKISDSEWKVVSVLWENHPLTANEIIGRLQPVSDWSAKTIKTMVFRLVKKGVIGFTNDRREYNYYPLLSREDCIADESQNFLNRIFGGAPASMISHFLRSQPISESEIDEIKKLLDDIKKDRQL